MGISTAALEGRTTLTNVVIEVTERTNGAGELVATLSFLPRAADPLVQVAVHDDRGVSHVAGYFPFDPEYGLWGASRELGAALPVSQSELWIVVQESPYRARGSHRDTVTFRFIKVFNESF